VVRRIDVRLADRIAAWATGVGIGLMVMMLTWLGGVRLAEIAWEPPIGPTVAFVAAIVAGLVAAGWCAVRLDRRMRG
jgi:hypothetical protein